MKSYDGKCLGKHRMKWKKCPRGRSNCGNCEIHVEVRRCDLCHKPAHHVLLYRDTGEPILIYCDEHLNNFKKHWADKKKNQSMRVM